MCNVLTEQLLHDMGAIGSACGGHPADGDQKKVFYCLHQASFYFIFHSNLNLKLNLIILL